jgi:hypothetical protein
MATSAAAASHIIPTIGAATAAAASDDKGINVVYRERPNSPALRFLSFVERPDARRHGSGRRVIGADYAAVFAH